MSPYPPPLVRAACCLFLAMYLAAPTLEATPSWEVQILVRHPDGREETVHATQFRFVFYERRYIRRSGRGEEKVSLQVKDTDKEKHWIQNHELRKIKFHKIRRIDFAYLEEEGEKVLLLEIERRKKKKVERWKASQLRNAGHAPLPHFRGIVKGELVDFPLPPLVEPATLTRPALVAIDFDFPGVKLPRKRF